MSDQQVFTPLPRGRGFGFSAAQPLSAADAAGYRYEQDGIYHNYHFTTERCAWPKLVRINIPTTGKLDGFSPNLNKKLHAGHIKQLAIASALAQICALRPVAMLGASQGIVEGAEEELVDWCELAQYRLYDESIVRDTELDPISIPGIYPGTGEYAGCKVWNGKNTPVVLYRSDNDRYGTYAAHDLSFAQHALAPDVYLTGEEQRPHFENLRLDDKHIPMGLLLGEDGKKMKSRDGTQVMAKDLFDAVKGALRPETPNIDQVTWNILAWNFNASRIGRPTKFNLQRWVNPDMPGLHITYTLARFVSALKDSGTPFRSAPSEAEIPMLAQVAYSQYAIDRARRDMEPCHVAQFAHDLAKFMGSLYSDKSSPKFRESTGMRLYALQGLKITLMTMMRLLGMWPVESI